MAKQKIVPGMQVRVARAHYHGIKFGAVCRVVADHLDGGRVCNRPSTVAG